MSLHHSLRPGKKMSLLVYKFSLVVLSIFTEKNKDRENMFRFQFIIKFIFK